VKRWKKTLEAQDAYKKVYDKWISKRKAAAQQAKAVRKASQSQSAEKIETKPVVPTKTVQAPRKVEEKKPVANTKSAQQPAKNVPKQTTTTKPAATTTKPKKN